MRIGFNARLLTSPDLRGFNRYTAELARALAATGRAEVVLFSDGPIHPAHGLSSLRAVVAAVRPQFRWQHLWLPAQIRRERLDLFHAPAHWGIPLRCSCPCVATIHDVADREMPAAPRGALAVVARHAFEEALVVRRARRIITVSQWSAASLRRRLGVSGDRIAVTVEGAAAAFGPVAPERVVTARAEAGLPERYFLYVGGFEPRKNVGALVRALAALPAEERIPVALVGGDRSGAAALLGDAARAGVASSVLSLGLLDDERLAALYSGALAVLVPSWVEGFGLPVVEAMHCGTPAIVADAASLPEVAGDAALTFPPAEPVALARHMARLAGDPALRATLAARARERAARFTWARAAEQTIAIYEEVLGGS